MQRSLPQAPRRCEEDASEELYSKSSSSSERETEGERQWRWREREKGRGREREREREGGKEREQYRQAETHRHNNYTYTASRHIMRQCRSNFKEKHRYIKNNRESGRQRGKQGVGGGVRKKKKKEKKEETMSTFISSVIPHQWRRAAILIKTKKYTQV